MIELKSIKKDVFNKKKIERTLFNDLSFSLPDEVRSIAIMGRSGSGKTTLLNIMAGLDVHYEGSYMFKNQYLEKDLTKMARLRYDNIGIITQKYYLLDDRTVLENILMGFKNQQKSSKKIAEDYLNLVGLNGYSNKKISQLSGGECQRVVIARTLVKQPVLLLADEPTGALDELTEQMILDIFEKLKEMGTKIILVTHSEEVASSCEQIWIIENRQLTLRQSKKSGNLSR